MRDPGRREQILDAADAVFAQAGYHAASMDEIAERVGVGKPVLYRHFGSKDGLYAAAVERAGDQLVRRLEAVAAQRAPREQLRAGVLAFFAFVEERRDGWVVLHRDGPAGAAAAGRLRELRARLAATIAQLLAREPGEREEALAHAIVGAGEALATYWVEHPSIPAEVVASELVELVWPGLERLAGARV